MKATHYYRLAFALPVLIGAVSAPLLLYSYGVAIVTGILSEVISKGSIDEYIGIALPSLFLIPVALAFVPVSAGSLWFLRNRDEAAHRRLARRAPWWLGLATACTTTGLVLALEKVNGVLPSGALILGALAVIVGYVYLVLAAALFKVLRACSVIDRS